MSYHVDRLMAAVSTMAGNGQVKQRLVEAYEQNLQAIDAVELPAAARPLFRELQGMMQSVAPLNGEGPIRATVRKMSIHDTDRCARLMVELLTEVVRASDSERRAAPVEDVRPVVPPFLVKSG